MNLFPRTNVRPAAFAGQFYPAEPSELRRMVESLLASVSPSSGRVPKALIAPHAGYSYSGPIAASSYARLMPARSVITRIVLLGPSHRLRFRGLATNSYAAFATPLGSVKCDWEACRKLESLSQVLRLDAAHLHEHSLEVHLPFLQVVLQDFSIIPLVFGEATIEEVCETLEAVWGGEETRLVISSDLSHYHEQQAARRIDARTANAIECLQADEIDETQACGRLAIQGLIRAAQRCGLKAHTLDLRNSGDTSGPRGRVVGYGAFEFAQP